MRTASIIINVIIFVTTFAIDLSYFRKDGTWNLRRGLKQFRFFTVLSNNLFAIAALMMAISQISGNVPQGILMMKYLGTMMVTLTFLTVLLFLGPTQGGYGKWFFERDFLYMHLIGPLLAILSFCLLERRRLSFGNAMTGLVPVALYGAVYLYKVILAPEQRRWEDFYSFNRGGMWQIAGAAMLVGTCAVCILYWVVCQG